MLNPLYYLAHDPVGNCEWQITEFDSGVLSEAESAGVVFIAVDKDGNRERVAAQDIKEPESSAGNLVLVQPVYVDDRMKAVVDVFDALAASVPAVAASADVQPVSSNARSAMSFSEALEALRKLAYPDSEEGGAQ